MALDAGASFSKNYASNSVSIFRGARRNEEKPIKMVGAWGFEPQTPTVSTPFLVTLDSV